MRRKPVLLVVLLICANCFAQQYPFVYYTPKDGLVNSRVRSIKQDSRGRMFFITQGGLSIYDGTHFANYSRQDGLATELVNDVLEISPDSFLVSTNASELNTLVNGKVGKFHTSDNFFPVINRFFKSNEDELFVAADEGLFLFSGKKFIHLPLFNRQGVDIGGYLDRILEWKNLFLITVWNLERKERMILYDWQKKKVLDVDTENGVFNFARDTDGNIWTTSGEKVLWVDTSALHNSKIRLVPVPEKYKSLSQNSSFILFDDEHNMWFYGGSRIMKISPQSQKQVFTSEQGLKTTHLNDLCIDKEGNAWFATDGNGVIKIKNDNIELLDKVGSSRNISGVSSQNDTTWFFSDNTIYRVYKDETKSFILAGKKMSGINFYLSKQKIYVGDGRRLVCVENKNKDISYQHPVTLFDNSGQNLSLGTGLLDRNGAIIQYVKKNDTLFELFVFMENRFVSETRISYMADQMTMDKEGRVWVATRDNHLMVFTTHPEQPTHYLQLLKDYKNEIPQMDPRCMTFDTMGNIWIGTRNHGVYRLEFDEMKFRSARQFNTQNGLTDNFIYSINCDAGNTIWIGTQTGLDKIFLKNGKFIIGNISKSNNFFQSIHKIVITKENIVLALTGETSILKTGPPSSKNSSWVPSFLFTSIQVNNQTDTDSSTIFSYKQNNLSFNAAALSFIDERSIQYSYSLEGSGNSNWSKPVSNSNFTFINLSPGDYLLKVKADFPEAIYPSQVISYAFVIRPPWWQTWWFRVIFGLLVAGTLFFVIRFYFERKLEKQKNFLERQQAIEKERTRIATDMHDDLGAGLSRIKFLSETIGIKKQKQLPFEEDITKIREYSHEMIDKMGEIVWALNEKNDTVSDLISYTRSYAVEYLSQSGIQCIVELPDLLPSGFVSGEFRRNIFLSVKEALHNIVKHAQANNVNIFIGANQQLKISIEDDGIGFDHKHTRPYSNGLTNMSKRMKDIGGALEIVNTKGTTIRLIAPL